MSLMVEQLNLTSHKHIILKEITFKLSHPGHVIALLGPNGAGKSSLLRCLAGLTAKHTGNILLNGQNLTALNARQRYQKICYLPQQVPNHAVLTVFESVLLAYNPWYWRMDKTALAKVAHLLQAMEIEALAERTLNELSGGQQQLVALGQVLIRSADLLLLDEPTSALDLKRQLTILQKLRDLTQQQQIITIIALHDLNLAARFADEIILIKTGQLLAVGDRDVVLDSQILEQAYEVTIEKTITQSGYITLSAYSP